MARLRRPPAVRMALYGTVVWVAAMMLFPVARIESLIVLSPLVIHPLVLHLCRTEEVAPKLHRVVSWIQLPAAAALVAGFLYAPGPLALALVVPWGVVTGLTALMGLVRIKQHGARDLPALCMSAGLVFLSVGGAWAGSAAAGYRPLGFSITIVYLTAAHFHYAGFVLPVIAGLVTRETDSPLTRWIPPVILAGVPLVAVGITVSPLVELGAALLLASGASATALGQLYLASRASSSVQMLLLGASALALLWAMVLAGLYAVSEYRGMAWPAIGEMVQLHGTVNALGFGLLGTWAWVNRQ